MAEQEIKSFLNQMKFRLKIADQTRKEMNLYLANDFNVFNFITPDENKLSDIFADLLNVNGAHGQGNLFLKEFLEIIHPPKDVRVLMQDQISVTREQTTDAISNSLRRVDLVMKFVKSEFWIGIENKPWAWDQPKQLSDYHENLRKVSSGKFFLVYLSGNGNDPGKESIDPIELQTLKDEGRFKTLGYPTELLYWLRVCRPKCEADKIRSFLADLIAYLEVKFSLLDD